MSEQPSTCKIPDGRISTQEAAENIRRAFQNYPSAEDIVRALDTKALQRQKEAAEARS